jgi:hypothetical protein
MKICSGSVVCALVVIAAAGCGREETYVIPQATGAAEQQSQRPSEVLPPERPAQDQPDDPTVASFLGFTAPKPATWLWHPPQSRMVTANFTVPGVGGAGAVGDDQPDPEGPLPGGRAAHVNVYFFNGHGGGVEANIERWQRQFRSPDGYEVEPVVERFEVDGLPVTLVELEGEWMQMGAAWYTRDQMLLGAIVEAPIGNIFIRFAGDQRTVEANREAFLTMIRGLRRE